MIKCFRFSIRFLFAITSCVAVACLLTFWLLQAHPISKIVGSNSVAVMPHASLNSALFFQAHNLGSVVVGIGECDLVADLDGRQATYSLILEVSQKTDVQFSSRASIESGTQLAVNTKLQIGRAHFNVRHTLLVDGESVQEVLEIDGKAWNIKDGRVFHAKFDNKGRLLQLKQLNSQPFSWYAPGISKKPVTTADSISDRIIEWLSSLDFS